MLDISVLTKIRLEPIILHTIVAHWDDSRQILPSFFRTYHKMPSKHPSPPYGEG